MGEVTVACVDDDTLIREGLARLLPGMRVVGAFATVEAFLAQRPAAQVVLLDLWLRDPGAAALIGQGAAGVTAVQRAGYRVLIYTNERRREVLAGCLAAGAQGVIHKSESLETLVDAARRVAGGQVVITTALAGLAEVVERRGGLPHLSPRQIDVLRGRARGETYKAIGARLGIAPKTAEEYMGEVNRRFSDYLRTHSATDLERHLGIGKDDLLGE
nr:response regulator transcription factor [Kineosphaera limosa]